MPFSRQETEQSIVERFHEQVRLHATRPALETMDETLTYAELDRCSNRVAHALLQDRDASAHAGPVALLFGNDISMVVAMLGVLKAGKAYVPLDPGYPAARLRQILESAQSSLLLTGDSHEALAAGVAQDIAAVSTIARLSEHAPDTRPDVVVTPDQPAYVLYTSGSTDTPKGVMQNHRNVLCNIRNYTNDIRIGPSDRLSLLGSFSFAASVSDLFGGLMNGAAVCLFDLQGRGIHACIHWLQSRKITIYYSVPSVFRLLVSALDGTVDLSRLRVIKLGGDSVTHADWLAYRKWFSAECVLVVSLGATEINLISRYIVDKDTELPPGVVPVGYPPDDVELLLLDDRGKPVAAGDIGELVVRSRHLAPGYWNEPDQRNSRLVPDADHPRQRLFRTGDVGRFHVDGCLIHLGRSDARVKISGQSVSLRELEAVLAEAPMVREAVVVAAADHDGDNRLTAYIVGENGAHPALGDVRRFLRERLPLYMVPHRFIPVDAFQYTQNGKLDRSALPDPGIERPSSAQAHARPGDDRQGRIVSIWSEVLGVELIGLHDNFMELGGDSLLALKIIARIREALGVDVPVNTFFEHCTPAGLCEVVGKGAEINWTPIVKR